jgi:D-serine deaminase-like pyridoxal phosphate-dependent protein
MTYPPAGKWQAVAAWLEEAKAACEAAGLSCARITSGGTPDLWHAGESRVVTEYRPGNYIYFDRSQLANGSAKPEDCALTVLATVVSRPTARRAILDAGSKSLSSDLLGLTGYGEIVGLETAAIVSLSEEHANVALAGDDKLPVGARVRVLPNHSCVVSNLFDRIHLISGDRVVDVLAVAARGHQG